MPPRPTALVFPSRLTALKRLSDLSLMDLESVRLILEGQSVVDWQRLHLETDDEAARFLETNAFDPTGADDNRRLDAIKTSAIDYLRWQFELAIPRAVADASVVGLLRMASTKGNRQLSACTILKAMHIIHHVEARELQYSLALSDLELFRLIEERVYRLVGQMLAEGLPITEFVGGRKRRASIYTKLLSKREAHASAIYDKQRFRIVTRSKDDIFPILLYLTHNLFAFNYVVPGESINTVVHFRSYCDAHPHLAQLARRSMPTDDFTLSDNRFSATDYRIIHFVVDVPVRVPPALLEAASPEARSLGPVIFGMCEFQIIDRETEEANEKGDASHASYKKRQRDAVMRRLLLEGARSSRARRPTRS
ncbi:MAG: TIGR04552 family protein [Myxococcales bacterium]|nr:TIGR04552 family protein [Myxococcales bacterium]